MDIFIDGERLDVTLETEQTVGDLFVSLEKCLSDTGFRFAAFALDGQDIHVSGVENAFAARLCDVRRIDVRTASVARLYAEALLEAAFLLDKYAAADGAGAADGKKEAVTGWETGSGRSFLMKDQPAFAKKLDACFFNGAGDGAKLGGEIAERLEEMKNPQGVLSSMKEEVYGITARLEALSLNMQMGKDREAAETVYLFSGVAEKLFRIIPLLPAVSGGAEFRAFLEEFTGVLKEFFAACQAQDSVLAGDLAEYEVSPRLIGLFDRLAEKNDSAAAARAVSAAKACCL
ncbi:MAG: hypothetical protein LBL31_08715 [Spirochaetaceae bacterium]|jgi:hypothetical protein|nr:hypothetical protein [Spirochaetaceae bacterium]